MRRGDEEFSDGSAMVRALTCVKVTHLPLSG